MTSERLQEMVRKILKRPGNRYAKQLLMGECVDGGEKKQQKIENWVQIELAKDLQKELPDQIVTIEEGNTDIVIKPSNNDLENHVGIELKIQGTKDSLRADALKLKKFLKDKTNAHGFLLIVMLLKTKGRKYKSWDEAFLALEPLKEINKMLEICTSIKIEPTGKRTIAKMLGIFCGKAIVG